MDNRKEEEGGGRTRQSHGSAFAADRVVRQDGARYWTAANAIFDFLFFSPL